MRNAKIIATFGPSVASHESTVSILKAGVDVARLNMSHGSHKMHQMAYDNIRRASAEVGRPVAIFADLQGPKIRIGRFTSGPHKLHVGDKFTITTRDIAGTAEICSTTHADLPKDVDVGDTLLIDDGKITLRAVDVDRTQIVTEVVVPGIVSDNKGINLPGVAMSVPALTKKDETDLRWALRAGVDMVALSFVRAAKDITRVHEIMLEEDRLTPVIAKVE